MRTIEELLEDMKHSNGWVQLEIEFPREKCKCNIGYLTWDGKYFVCKHNVKHKFVEKARRKSFGIEK